MPLGSGARDSYGGVPLDTGSCVPGGLQRDSRRDRAREGVVREDLAEEVLAELVRGRVQVEVPGQSVLGREVGLRGAGVVEAREVTRRVRESSGPDKVLVAHRGNVNLGYREVDRPVGKVHGRARRVSVVNANVDDAVPAVDTGHVLLLEYHH